MRDQTESASRGVLKSDIGLRRRLAVGVFPLLCAFSVGGHAQMTLPGEFVASEGAATYAIPIKLPPDVGSAQPALALSYSSQAGNSLVGIGWNLTGLSSITRCPQTMAQDGAIGVVGFKRLSDRYCLNGQRLRATDGVEGANASVEPAKWHLNRLIRSIEATSP